jgi:hypothetical protein
MNTLWPDSSRDPGQNLARGAAVAALGALQAIPAGGVGFSTFSTQDVISCKRSRSRSAHRPIPGGSKYDVQKVFWACDLAKQLEVSTAITDHSSGSER